MDITGGGAALPQLFDLNRVEVLRGPQGTLFGSSAEGGAIRFITPSPRTDQFSGDARLGFGFTQSGQPSYLTGVAVGGPIGDDGIAGFRFSALEQRDGGYINHVGRTTGESTGKDTNSFDLGLVRAALVFKPIGNLSITPAIYYQDSSNNDRATFYKDAGVFETYNHVSQPSHDRFTLGSLSVDVDFDRVNLKSVTSSFDRTLHRLDDYSYLLTPPFTGGPESLPGLPNYTALSNNNTTQFNLNQEFRLTSVDSPADRLSWTAGTYFARTIQRQNQAISQDINTFAQALFGTDAVSAFGEGGIGSSGSVSYTDDENLVDRTAALFGEANYKISNQTTVTLGVRLAKTAFEYQSTQNGPLNGGLTSFSGSQEGHSVLPKFSLSHDLDKQEMLYITVAKGDRVGGANASYATVPGCASDLAALGITDAPRTYSPDSLWSYEAGYKGTLLDDRLEIASAVFLIDWKNIQEPILLPTCQFTFTANLAQAKSVGAEMQSQYRVNQSISLFGTMAYTDARFTQDAYAWANFGELLVKKDQAMPSPPFTATLGAQYRWTPVAGASAYTRANLSYASGYHAVGPEGTYNYDPLVRDISANHYLTIGAGYTEGNWTWSTLLDNVFNAQADLMRFRYSPNDPSLQAATFRPRTIKFSVAYKF